MLPLKEKRIKFTEKKVGKKITNSKKIPNFEAN